MSDVRTISLYRGTVWSIRTFLDRVIDKLMRSFMIYTRLAWTRFI